MAKGPLTDKHRTLLNRDLKELERVQEEIGKAKLAGSPNIAVLEQRCNNCVERIKNLKKQYFPGKG